MGESDLTRQEPVAASRPITVSTDVEAIRSLGTHASITHLLGVHINLMDTCCYPPSSSRCYIIGTGEPKEEA